MIRTLIVDDHKLVREGLIQILSDTPDICVVGEAGNGRDALDKAQELDPTVVLLDVSMPEMDGLSALQVLVRLHPSTAVLMLSMYPEEQYAVRCLKAGAAGYLTKESASEELIDAIRKVAEGGRYVSRSLAERLAFELGRADYSPHDLLSIRELQTLRMIAQGRSLSEIAADLSLSVKTVSTYRSRLLTKLKLHSTAELVRYAIEHGLV